MVRNRTKNGVGAVPTEDKMKKTIEILKDAREALKAVSSLSEEEKNKALIAMSQSIRRHKDEILAANEKDVNNAYGKISDVMIDRLKLSDARIEAMACGISDVAKLPDPVGKVISSFHHKNKMTIDKVCVPMGVVAIIYESRPNVTSDAAALALKSSNVCILRTGREAILSASAIVDAMRRGLEEVGVTKYAINLIEDTSHESAKELMEAVGYVDLLIPRGGAGLISACLRDAKVPCIQTGTGICHIFVDEYADEDMALSIINNAKTSRPSVCNAEEVCLVHEKIADTFLPMLKKILVDDRIKDGKVPVELRLDEKSAAVIDGTPAGEGDFDTEFNDYILAVKVVRDTDEAIDHIGRHSTHHSEAIITKNKENADKFTASVDSAAVYVNVSTRFTDGGEFGLGCEMGISTQKLHARGPMGICELTSYKYVIHGNGQIR